MELDDLKVWDETKKTIKKNVKMNLRLRLQTPYSDDKNSDYQQIKANLKALQEQRHKHVLNGLQLVDDAIKDSAVLDEIKQASANARDETDRITKITHTVKDLTGMVDTLSGLVGGFGKLLAKFGS